MTDRIKISRIVDDLLAYVPGCPLPQAVRAFRTTMREACQKADIWRHEYYTSIIKDMVEIDLDIPSGASPLKVLAVTIEGLPPLKLKTEHQLRNIYGDWRRASPMDPQFFHYTSTTYNGKAELYVVPKPRMSLINKALVEVTIQPSLFAEEVPAHVVERWYEMLSAGSLWRLQGMKNKEWFSRQDANDNFTLYMDSLEYAQAEVRQGNQDTGLNTGYGGL